MTTTTNISRPFSTLQKWTAILLCTAGLMGCAGSRYGLEAASCSGVDIDARALQFKVADSRGAPAADRAELSVPKQLKAGAALRVPVGLTTKFKVEAARQLSEMADGDGATLEVVTEVNNAEVAWSKQADGDVAKVTVDLTFSVYDDSGNLVQRGSASSTGELSADDASPEELTAAVEATALNALSKYWAREKTVAGLNKALGGQG
jgi:hypothetical protein